MTLQMKTKIDMYLHRTLTAVKTAPPLRFRDEKKALKWWQIFDSYPKHDSKR